MTRLLQRARALLAGAIFAASFIHALPLPGQYPNLEQFSPIQTAEALNLGQAVASTNGVYYVSQYPLGNAPTGGGNCPPTGYAEFNLGTSGGTFCDTAGVTTGIVTGTDSITNAHIASISCGSLDCEIKAEVNNDFAGNLAAGAAFGVGIRSDNTSGAEVMQCKSLYSGNNAVQCQTRIAGATSSTDCASSGTTRPVRMAVTWDDSENTAKGFTSVDNGASWQECLSATFSTFTSPSAFFIGSSKSATISTTASLDNIAQGPAITVYTPAGGGSGPTLLSSIPDQVGAQGAAFTTLSLVSYFSGQTSYSKPANGTANGFPTSTGFSLNTSTGAVTGTPTSADASASPFPVSLCGVNAFGTTCDTVVFTIAAVPGDVLVVSGATINCATYEGGGAVDPDDVLEIPGGVRGPIEFINCHGTAAKPIVIRNKLTDASPATIRRTSGGTSVFMITNSSDWVLDGSLGYSGSGSGTVGYNQTNGAKATTESGIRIEATGGTSGFLLRVGGTSCSQGVNSTTANGLCKINGVRFDGGNTSGAAISVNDHAFLWAPCIAGKSAAEISAQCWRQNIEISNNYIVRSGDLTAKIGEGMYVGPNQLTPAELANGDSPDVPLRNLNIHNNYMRHTARDAINTKSVLSGSNRMEYNWIDGFGETGESDQNRGLNMNGAADWEVRGNVVLNGGGDGFLMNWQDVSSLSPNSANTVLIENSIFANVGRTATAKNPNGFTFTRNSSSPTQNLTIRNVTVAGAPEDGIRCGGNVTGSVLNSIIAGVATGINNSGGSCSNTSNTIATGANAGARATAITNQNFVTFSNDDNATNDNFELTSSSGACNQSNNNSVPSIDYEGEARPEPGTNSDRGADEATACP